MKKIIALSIAAVLSFNNVHADYYDDDENTHTNRNPKTHPQTESNTNVGIYASYLYWQLGSYNTFYQTTCEQMTEAMNAFNLYPEGGTNFVRSRAKCASGFNVGVEYLSDELDQWSFGVQYQWIKHHIVTINNCCNPCNVCEGTCDSGWAWWGACCWLGQAQFGLTNSSSLDMEDAYFNPDSLLNKSFAIEEVQRAVNTTSWQSVDITIAKAMHIDASKHISFEPKFGVEFNLFKMESFFNGKFLEQNYYSELQSDYEGDYFQWCVKDTPWAIGPFGGANLGMRFSNTPSSFVIFGNFKVAELYTKHTYNQAYTEDSENPCDDYSCGSICSSASDCKPNCCNTECCETDCCESGPPDMSCFSDCFSSGCCGPTDVFFTTTLHTHVKFGTGYVFVSDNTNLGFDINVAWELNSFVNFFDAVHAWMWEGDLAYQGLTITLGLYF